MERRLHEKILQNYLTTNYGANLKRIDSSLLLIETEHKFKGGRIDILAENQNTLIGIELKAFDYNTRGISSQLLNYLNYLSPQKGIVYFVAPKIKYGIYSTLKNFYDNNKLKFFEFEKHKNDYDFKKISPEYLDDRRKAIKILDFESNTNNPIYEEKLKKSLAILIKDKKKCKLIESIINTGNSRQKQLETITDNTVDFLFSKKEPFIKTMYELLKIL